ncbi:hypothetical protein ADK76_33350 [Streptomyces griseoflavus]|uniref:hypothetical protein n=1 Tax=Streptomyces rimosus TaxID=1927 RepID=UPI0004CC5FB3|nr:hypothetical protein [Streptomyces rimosus]KOG52194.1 hypothetical protein ADK76_33350 [Streptomyces griseoflavus]
MTPPATAPAGTVTTVAGTGAAGFDGGGGPAVQARLNGPRTALDRPGNLHTPEAGNHRVRKVGADGIGKHAPVRISAEITGGSRDEPALRPAQESVPEAKPGDRFAQRRDPVAEQPAGRPGHAGPALHRPTGSAFTDGASYESYYFVQPAVTGKLRTQLEDGGRTLIIFSDPHLDTGAPDGSAAIGRPAPVPLSAHVLRPRQEQRS